MRTRTKRFKLLVIAGALLFSELAMVSLNSPAANAAFPKQLVSPIPANMTHYGRTEPSTQNITRQPTPNANVIRHVIKKEASSTMNQVKMAAYFNAAAVNSAYSIRITDRDTRNGDERCATYRTASTNRNQFIQVTLSTELNGGGTSSRTYNVRDNNVCSGASGTNGSNFFGSYAAPPGFVGSNCSTAAGRAKCDPETGLYRIAVTIAYGPTVPNGTSDDKQQVTFRVQLDSACGSNAGRICYLSTVEAGARGSGTRNYSTLGPFNPYGNPWYTDQSFQFGLPCTARNRQFYTVQLYDVDNQGAASARPAGTWGAANDATTFVIQKKNPAGTWVTLNLDDTLPANNDAKVSFNPAYTSFNRSTNTFTPRDGSGTISAVQFWMQPDANYRIKVSRVHNRNLLGVGLPTETIFGDISCNYNLVPEISGVPSTVTPGASVSTVRGAVDNSTSVSSYGRPQSAVVRFVVPASSSFAQPGAANQRTNSNTTAAAAGCALATAIISESRDCRVYGAAARDYPRMDTVQVWSGSDSLAGVPLSGGDRVCYMTIVNLYNQPAAETSWSTSQIQCAVVLTQPKVALWGNDLRVGSSFSGGTNLNAGVNAIVAPESASWVEYAITAPSAVSGLASQSGAVRGSADAQGSWSRLTFANTGASPGCPGGYGCFAGATALGKIPDVRTAVSTMSYGGSALNRNVGATSFSASGIGGIIGGADLGNFTRSASITTTGTITIDQDIVYDSGAIAGEGAIPQLILVGNNINITGNVRRIDAWLIATGTVNTCSDVASQAALRANNCNNQLRINGPIMANQLALNRTYADNTNNGEVAETVNLRGDAYVWASRVARQNGHWQTVFTTELPPRY